MSSESIINSGAKSMVLFALDRLLQLVSFLFVRFAVDLNFVFNLKINVWIFD